MFTLILHLLNFFRAFQNLYLWTTRMAIIWSALFSDIFFLCCPTLSKGLSLLYLMTMLFHAVITGIFIVFITVLWILSNVVPDLRSRRRASSQKYITSCATPTTSESFKISYSFTCLAQTDIRNQMWMTLALSPCLPFMSFISYSSSPMLNSPGVHVRNKECFKLALSAMNTVAPL